MAVVDDVGFRYRDGFRCPSLTVFNLLALCIEESDWAEQPRSYVFAGALGGAAAGVAERATEHFRHRHRPPPTPLPHPARSLKMIDDTDLGFFSNFLGISIFVLLVAYHYVVAEPKVKT